MKTLLLALVPFIASGLAAAADVADWNKPSEAFRIVGPVHYVGTSELGAYLVRTADGLILVDGGLPESAPLIEKSIRTLGLDPKDIKILLTTQAHFDHVGSMAHFQKLSGARVEAMDGDVPILESGGKTDYLFGGSGSRYLYDPVKVTRTLKDGDTVTLGGLTLTARRTPGHTPGSTTWLTTVKDGARSYQVVFAGSTSINPGTRLVKDPSYPGIAEDFAHSFEVLESLEPDVFLAAHTGFFGLDEKRARLKKGGGENPFVDLAAFRAHVAAKKRAYLDEVARQRAGGSTTP